MGNLMSGLDRAEWGGSSGQFLSSGTSQRYFFAEGLCISLERLERRVRILAVFQFAESTLLDPAPLRDIGQGQLLPFPFLPQGVDDRQEDGRCLRGDSRGGPARRTREAEGCDGGLILFTGGASGFVRVGRRTGRPEA